MSKEDKIKRYANDILNYAKNNPDTEKNSKKIAKMLEKYYKYCYKNNIDSYKVSNGILFNDLQNLSYIIDSKPILLDLDEEKTKEAWNHLLNVLGSGGGISEEEANTLLSWSVGKAREVLGRGDKNILTDSLTGACGYSQMLTLLAFTKAGVKTTINNTSYFSDYSGRHAFGTVTFPIEKDGKVKEKQYLIDATYRQFFTTSRCNEGRLFSLEDKGKIDAGYYMINYLEGKDIATEILKKGYIELTRDVLMKYANAFIAEGITLNNRKEYLSLD